MYKQPLVNSFLVIIAQKMILFISALRKITHVKHDDINLYISSTICLGRACIQDQSPSAAVDLFLSIDSFHAMTVFAAIRTVKVVLLLIRFKVLEPSSSQLTGGLQEKLGERQHCGTSSAFVDSSLK